jgi:Predicted sugar kinase
MVLLLCPLVEFKQSIETAQKVAGHLKSLGVRCIADDLLESILGSACGIEYLTKQQAEQQCDYVVAIGGDGTILRVAQRAIALDKPMFGINTGRVGFLAAFDVKNLESITPSAIEELSEETRLLLDFSLKSTPGRHYYAVNDIVVSKSNETNTIEVDLEYGRYSVGRICADGVIVSTPTGSTAYSLSAGGPIVAPMVDAVIITPVCSHSLFSRSFVLGTHSTVSIAPSGRTNNRGHILVDGVNVGPLERDDCVIIKGSEKRLRLLRSEKRNFYDILNREISEKD